MGRHGLSAEVEPCKDPSCTRHHFDAAAPVDWRSLCERLVEALDRRYLPTEKPHTDPPCAGCLERNERDEAWDLVLAEVRAALKGGGRHG